MEVNILDLTSQVQRNCDRSDARYSGLYSLCGFLLRFRDLYKWEQGLLPWQEADPETLLAWMENRERHWEALVEDEFAPLTIGASSFDPFHAAAVNEILRPLGWVYGAGYVAGMKPSFFLAESVETRSVAGLQVDIVELELARDLFMTPLMRQGEHIYARRAAMLGFIWDQLWEMRPSGREGLTYGLSAYGLDAEAIRRSPSGAESALRQLANAELETWVHHEVGEAKEDIFPGQLWQEMVASYAGSPVEILARVVKDWLADTHREGLLAHILANDRKSSLGFYIAFMGSFLRVVFPEIREGFRRFREDGDWEAVDRLRAVAHSRARDYARALIEAHETGRREGPEWARERIMETLIAPLGILHDPGGTSVEEQAASS